MYPIVLIGDQLWMAKNMNYEDPNGGWVHYNNDQGNSLIYGKLYNWTAAQNVCPSGWHLPSDAEFMELEKAVGMSDEKLNVFGERCCGPLKEGAGSGFNALLGGLCNFQQGSTFQQINSKGYFWTSTEQFPGYKISRTVNASDPRIGRTTDYYQNFESVRCLYNEKLNIPVPSVEISTFESIQTSEFTCNGNLTCDGSVSITEIGLCWDTLPDPTINSSHLQGQLNDGSFQMHITGLKPNKLYYVKAYARYAYGTIYYDLTYSSERSVKTFSDPAPEGDYIVDSRDGNIYKFAEIEGQTWLIDNLAYYAPGSSCWIEVKYDDSGRMYTKVHDEIGRFYNWGTAMNIDPKYSQYTSDYYDVTYPHQGVCPSGWHIPSKDDWTVFEEHVENSSDINTILHQFNWNGILCGNGHCGNFQIGVGYYSSTQGILENSIVEANAIRFDDGDPLSIGGWPRFYKWPLRCIKTIDNEPPIIVTPENITVLNDPGKCSAAIVLQTPEVTDNAGVESINNNAPSEFPVGTTVVLWTATDINGNTSTAEQLITVTNERPVITSILTIIDPVPVNANISMIASYVDNNIGSAFWEWGDDNTSEGAVGLQILGDHAYARPGVFTVKLNVTDICGETNSEIYQYIVVYDPEGAFVTGGGWINSPVGASTEFPEAVGKANFGFESKYNKGASVPSGNTEFQFKAGNLNFQSTLYEWMVIAGNKALFKGEGTINHLGWYGFMLSAVDGNLKTPVSIDRFRIRIWDKNDNDLIIYDNDKGNDINTDPMTTIAGGSIVIHASYLKSTLGFADNTENADDRIQFDVFPNPCKNVTFISLVLPYNESISMVLCDLNGRKVKEIYRGTVQKGINYLIEFSPDRELENGNYLLNMVTTSGDKYVQRLVLNR